ncbi:hypothetical protein BKA62DRAFT_690604 [Auriculariales sp. MPI-PUGE-AT-0066]|nr:hypothetical protein BKA62DRAFT_690604 [Auriculariales sp. MPI-PUGE-AT-0066]
MLHQDDVDATLSGRFSQLKQELHDLDSLMASCISFSPRTKMEGVSDAYLLEDPDESLIVVAEGSLRFSHPISASEFQDPSSPFYADTLLRQAYLANSETNRLGRGAGEKEREILKSLVVNANKRVWAARVQNQGADGLAEIYGDNDVMQTFFTANMEDLDWESIAQDFSREIWPAPSRTATECRIAWRDGLRPNINRDTWTDAEDSKLSQLVEDFRERGDLVPDWEEVAMKLDSNRIALDCMRRAVSTQDKVKWTSELDKKLASAVERFGTQSWSQVALYMGSLSGPQCEKRWKHTSAQVRGKWSEEEDELLRRSVALFPPEAISWTHVAQQVPGRTNTQCRDRFTRSTQRSRHGRRSTAANLGEGDNTGSEGSEDDQVQG